MPVMPAGMHFPFVLGTVAELVFFQKRQGIHIRSKADGGALTIFQSRHHPCTGKSLVNWETKAFKFFCYKV